MTAPGDTALIVAILGPTASGKSVLAIRLAKQFAGEVLACDSTQVYRHFDIGTGKVSPEEGEGVPHHLVDLVAPGEVFTAGEYRQRAIAVLQDLRQRGKLPILTVGTGLYLRALAEGLADAPTRSEEFRERLRRAASHRPASYLHQMLKRLDPESASRIAPADRAKLIRAIEISLLAGKPASEVHRQGRPGLPGYRVLRMGLNPPRTALYERIEARVLCMIEAGWLEEVRSLQGCGLSDAVKPFQFIGYRDLLEVVRGKAKLDAAIKAIQQSTRQYAKRQLTWFRKEPGVKWIEGFGESAEAFQESSKRVGAETGAPIHTV